MEIKDLQYFLKVVEHGSFTKAAAETFLSQPTLSKSIKKLETELNVHLLERSTRSLKLTDAGYIVYKQGQKILNSVKELHILLDEMRMLPTGEVKFGVPPIVGTLFFPFIAKNFKEKHPLVSLQLIEVGAKKIEILVEEGQVDVGIIAFPTNMKKFNVYPFIAEEFMVYMSVNHPFQGSDPVNLRQFAKENFIILTKEFTTREIVLQACQNEGFTPNIVYESSQWDLIMELVSHQIGITLLPKSIYKQVDKEKVRAVPIKSSPLWELAVITRKDGYESFAVKALLNFLSVDMRNLLNSN